MRRFSPRLLVDVLMWLALTSLVSTGLLMAFRLPPGSGPRSLWGLTRHEWGDWHFYSALTFLGLLGFHLILNAKWLSCALGTALGGSDPARREGFGWIVLGLLAAMGGLILAIPWSIPVEAGSEEGGHRGAGPALVGSMTLAEAAAAEGIELPRLIEALGLPPDTPPEARLGRLGRQYGFTMEKVREAAARLRRER